MTVLEFCKQSNLEFSHDELISLGQMIYKRSKKETINHSKKKQIEGTFTYSVNDYPIEFVPTMQKILKQFQFILKNKNK